MRQEDAVGAGRNAGFTTRQVHVGSDAATATPRALPIHLTAGFTFDSFDDAAAHFGTGDGFGYTRTGNPTVDAVERKLASLEGGVARQPASVATISGIDGRRAMPSRRRAARSGGGSTPSG